MDRTGKIFPLPRRAYVPGTGNEPDRESLERVKVLVPPRFDGAVPASDVALTYGLALNDAGFFWESHEVLEAVWKAAPKGGLDRICLRACIQIANANLKLKMGKLRAAERLMAEAADELAELKVRRRSHHNDGFAGSFPAELLAERLKTWNPGDSATSLAIRIRDMKENA
jgi:hypothetical protein